MLRFSIIVLFIIANLQAIFSQSTSTFADSITTSNLLYTRLYGELVYNQKLADVVRHNGNLDARRIVLMFGYQPQENIQFVSEIEFEHANEIFVEQAFIKYHFNNLFNLKAGVLLIPSGIVNEDHEPTSFYPTDRPFLDKVIVPSTWREMGIGFSGLSINHSLKYQAYLVNGLLSYNGSGLLNGSGLRGGRQKAIKSTISTLPSLTTKVEYFGIPNLKIGIAGYYGSTQSSAYDGVDKENARAIAQADSTIVDLSLISAHLIYRYERLQIRSQLSWASIGNTTAYNEYTQNDLAEQIIGYYATIAYSVLQRGTHRLDAFAQYSRVNTHAKVAEEAINPAYDRQYITLGLNWLPHPSVVFKMDHQFISKGDGHNYQQFNTGVGVWF